jgi:hypothetical protein
VHQLEGEQKLERNRNDAAGRLAEKGQTAFEELYDAESDQWEPLGGLVREENHRAEKNGEQYVGISDRDFRVQYRAGFHAPLAIFVQTPHGLGAHGFEQRRDGFAGCRIAERGVEFRERFQNEAALAIARVRDLKLLGSHDCVAVENDVDIDCARTVDYRANAAEVILDVVDAMQQLQGEERGLEFRHLVEEPGLIGESHGRRFVEAAGAQQLQIRPIEFFESLPQPGFTISQVGTEREPGRLQKSSGWRSTPPKRRGTLK